MTQLDHLKKSLKYDPKNLLVLFNEQDRESKGFVTPNELAQILRNKLQNNEIQIKNNEYFTFDDLLSILSIYETPEHPSSYVIIFLKMLSQYQKKCESLEQFEQVQKTANRINQIKARQLNRRRNLLKQKQKFQWIRIQKIHQHQLKQFNQAWNDHLDQFEKNSSDMFEQIKNKHLQELQRQENSLRSELNANPKYSKKILQLKNREKTLLKIRNYNQVMKARKIINKAQDQQNRVLEESYESTIFKKLKSLRKQQNIALDALANKIINERMILLTKKKQDTDCLLLRIKNLKNDVKKKFQQQQKKLNEFLKDEFNNSNLRRKIFQLK